MPGPFLQIVRGASIVIAGLFCTAFAGSAVGQSDRFDEKEFLQAVRQRLRSDEAILRGFIHRRHVVERDRDERGRVIAARTRTWEVHPVPDDPAGMRWLVARDGRPVPKGEIARHEADYRRRLERLRQRGQRETPAERARRLAREAARHAEAQAEIADALAVFRVSVAGRERLRGVSAVVVTFTPRSDVQPRTRAGRFLQGVKGRAWFSEADHELMRAEAEVTDTFRYGWGILAKINKGATAVIERQRLPDGQWVPARYELSGSGRILLVRGIIRDATVTFSDFRPAPEAARAIEE